MAILKMFKCKDCAFEFSDLDEDLYEVKEIDPIRGIEKKIVVPKECPNCGDSNIEPIIENGKQKDA